MIKGRKVRGRSNGRKEVKEGGIGKMVKRKDEWREEGKRKEGGREGGMGEARVTPPLPGSSRQVLT